MGIHHHAQVCSEADKNLAISALLDCFEHTNWHLFREAATYEGSTNLKEYTTSPTGYISLCTDEASVSKTITTEDDYGTEN